MSKLDPTLLPLLTRMTAALERLAPPPSPAPDMKAADAFIWRAESQTLYPVMEVSRVSLNLLQGINSQRDTLLLNTRQFANGLPANNALLWGVRGSGKSSLVKAVHAHINQEQPQALALVEIHREDIPTLPDLLALLRMGARRCILFCDDLSFDGQDDIYKSLKAVLEGGLEGRPENVLFYATSNRRHLMPRDMIENERSTAVNPSETAEENLSLSDRFGLWLGFHNCDQATFFAMIDGYVRAYNLGVSEAEWKPKAVEWTVTRGARSGRVAWQFVQALAGEAGKPLSQPEQLEE